jgi:hypothetical protein
MTLMKDNEEEILRVVRTWVSRKHKSFPNWSQDELLSEAWLAVHSIMHRYDPKRGDLAGFIYTSIYCPTFRSYAKAKEIKISRIADDNYKKRHYSAMFPKEPTLKDAPYIVEEEADTIELKDIVETYKLKPRQINICNLLARGLNKKHVAHAHNRTQGWVSQQLHGIATAIKPSVLVHFGYRMAQRRTCVMSPKPRKKAKVTPSPEGVSDV